MRSFGGAFITHLPVVFLAALFSFGCGETGDERKAFPRLLPPDGSHNVLLITVDTLRSDHLGCYGYARPTSPNVDTVARDGVRFLHAQSPRSLTWPSLSSILTARYPRTHGVRRNGDKLDPSVPTLPRVLRARGWLAASFAASMKTAPDPGVDERFVSERGSSWPEQDRQVTRAAIGWIEKNKDRRFFAWLHYIGPHDPYHPDPPYDTMFDPDYRGPYDGDWKTLDRITSERIDLSERDLQHIVSLYDGEIRATDEQIGQVLGLVERLGLRDSTLVILTADHGEELYQRNHYFQHGCSVYDSTLHVPLLMRLPEVLRAGARIDPTVELLDVMPTVLALERIPAALLPEGMEGFDMSALVRSSPLPLPAKLSLSVPSDAKRAEDRWIGGARFSVAEYRDKILALRTDEWRYIYNPEEFHPKSGVFKIKPNDSGYAIGREELYRSSADTLERDNVIDRFPEVARQLREALMRWAASRPNDMRERELDKATIEEMKSLGYIR